MSKQGTLAVTYFHKGYNCCQSVVAAFHQDLGLTETFALRISSGFGAGIGRMREVCGAFNGLTMVISLKYADAANPDDKSKIYGIIQELAEQFKANNTEHSLICRELLHLEQAEGCATAGARTAEYYEKRPCADLVRLAADLAASYLKANP